MVGELKLRKRGVMMNKESMSEQDIRTKYITPTIINAGFVIDYDK